jgi:porin
VNPVKFFASGGLGGRGVIPGRDNDTFGVGYFYQDIVTSRLADRLGFEDNSQGFEAYYNFAISPSSFLTSDIQVLDAPFTELDTAVVLGMRLKIVF